MITAMSLTNGTLTVIFDGGNEILTAREDNPKWAEIKEAFKRQDEARLRTLLSLKAIVEEYTIGTLTVNATGVLSLGKPIHTVDAERVMAFLRDGLPYQPIANYIERKLKNPSARAINEMYAFLEHKGMPLTPKGTFIAYKGVQPNWYSVRGNKDTVVVKGTVNEEGQILNTVGEVIEVLRSSVDDDFRQGCSFGLHAGSLAYARGWGARVVLVEIDPADVVSVPEDCNCQKLRCCKYTVIGEYTGPMPDTYTDEFTPEDPEEDICHECGAETGTCDCDDEQNCTCGGTDCPNCGCDCDECQGNTCDCGCQGETPAERNQRENEAWLYEQCKKEDASVPTAGDMTPIPNAPVPPPAAEPIPNASTDECPRCQYDKFACICGESAPPNVSQQPTEKETTRELLIGVLNNFLTPEDKARIDAEVAVEKRVIAIFAEQLGFPEKDIFLTQTGANLGMDSLDGVELAMALEEEFGFEIPDEIAEKYEGSTIGEICKGIAEYLAKGKPPIVLQDSYAHGYGVGQADRRNGTPPVFRSGDETAADSDKHRDYIVGYLRGYANQ